jgi:hypothetical protein
LRSKGERHAREEVKSFVAEYVEWLENDSRHEFWIGSTETRGKFVYEEHALIDA